MWDRTGENQVYVRQQKAAEEQLRFDRTEMLSFLPPGSRKYALEAVRVELGLRRKVSSQDSTNVAGRVGSERRLAAPAFVGCMRLSGGGLPRRKVEFHVHVSGRIRYLGRQRGILKAKLFVQSERRSQAGIRDQHDLPCSALFRVVEASIYQLPPDTAASSTGGHRQLGHLEHPGLVGHSGTCRRPPHPPGPRRFGRRVPESPPPDRSGEVRQPAPRGHRLSATPD